MNYRARKIIAFFFIAVFAVTAPAVVLYTSGYRYNWKKNKFEKTGIIQVDSKPVEADILLNGVHQIKKTPASFPKLLPDDYAITLSKPGYLTWKKTLNVRSIDTTFANDVILFRDSLPRQMIRGAIRAAAFSPKDGRLAFLRTSGDISELIVADGPDRVPVLLARFAAADYQDEKLSWSPNSLYLAFSAKRRAQPPVALAPVLFIYPMTAGFQALPAHELVSAREKNAKTSRITGRWTSDGGHMTVVTDNGDHLVTAATGEVRPIAAATGIVDVYSDGPVYTLSTEKEGDVSLEKTASEGRPPQLTLATFPPGVNRIIGADESSVLVADGRAGKAYLIDAESGEAMETFTATDAVWEKQNGGRILLWNDFEISIYDPSTQSRTLVTRLGTAILGCAWHPAGKHVIYSTATEITAIELDDRDGRNSFELARFSDIQTFFVEPAGDRIDVVGAIGTQQGEFEKDL